MSVRHVSAMLAAIALCGWASTASNPKMNLATAEGEEVGIVKRRDYCREDMERTGRADIGSAVNRSATAGGPCNR